MAKARADAPVLKFCGQGTVKEVNGSILLEEKNGGR